MSNVAIDHGSSRPGRWLRTHRTRIALWTAAIEAILVALLHDVSRWTVIGLAVIAVAVYVAAGRESRSDTFRQLSWIFAASQLLAVAAAILAFVFFWIAIIVAVIAAAIALVFLFTERK
jgi:hypothetical protein